MSAAVGSVLLAFGAGSANAQTGAALVPAVQPVAAAQLAQTSQALRSGDASPYTAVQVTPAILTTTTAPAPAAPVAPAQPAAPMSLAQLVAAYTVDAPLTEELTCLATAIYFEAKGESLEGQLAVAEVVENRASSGRYPTSLCGVVKQKKQFSFVRAGGIFPRIDPDCPYWKRAQAVARIAASHLATTDLSDDVLWYHADYVAPKWRRALTKVEQIGAHIFYRA